MQTKNRSFTPHPETTDTQAAGTLSIVATEASHVSVDAAWSNSFPANEPTSSNGSTVLDLGRRVKARASAHVSLVDGAWTVTHLSATQFPSRRDLTVAQTARLKELLAAWITQWADENPDVLEAAEAAKRNNAAGTLENAIARHEQALAILRENLAASENGEPFSAYPDLPTDGR